MNGAAKNSFPQNRKPQLIAEVAYENASLVPCDVPDQFGAPVSVMRATGTEEHPIHKGPCRFNR